MMSAENEKSAVIADISPMWKSWMDGADIG